MNDKNKCNVNEEKNPLLTNTFMLKFDFEQTKSNIDKLMANIEEWKYSYINLSPPTITSSYEVHYENHNLNVTDKIGEFVQKKVDMEKEIDKVYQKLKIVLEKLNREELDYFNMSYYNRKSETIIGSRLCVGHTQLLHIKKSCIIKIALGLEQAVRI